MIKAANGKGSSNGSITYKKDNLISPTKDKTFVPQEKGPQMKIDV